METTQDTTAQAAQPVPNPLERRIDLAVTLVEIEREVEQQLKRIAKTAKMAGFRPGKVPMKMVAQMQTVRCIFVLESKILTWVAPDTLRFVSLLMAPII